MLLTGKEPAQQLYAQIDQRISAAATVPGLFALYDPEDVPAGWYLRSIQRAGEAHGIPVIYLTAKNDLESKLTGLTAGAEDYIVKPFEIMELLVRMEKVLSRHCSGGVLTVSDLVIQVDERTVTKQGKPIPLKPLEFDLLLFFVRNRNIALSREKILTEVWGLDFYGESRTIDIHVSQLRKKTGLSIVSIPRVGYRLEIAP